MTAAPAPAPAARSRSPSRIDRRDLATVAAPALLALTLCAVGMNARSLGFDEAASVAIATQHGSGLARAIAHDGGNMSGYYVVLHGLVSLLGTSLWVIRAPSALATAATVALTATFGLRRFDRRVALIAGVLTALSLPLVFWGQSARGYALMVALTTGSFVAFSALVKPGPPRRAVWAAYALCTALAVYTGFVAVLIVPAQLVVLAWHPGRAALRRVSSALALAVLSWLPLVALAAARGSGQLFWVPRPTFALERQVVAAIASAGLPPSFRTTASTIAILVVSAAAVVVAGVAARRLGPSRRPVELVASWFAVPVALAWLESLAGQPIFLPRNLLVVVPAAALLLALALSARGVPRTAAWSLLAALIVLRAVQVAGAYGVSPEDWKAAAGYVLTRTAPGDCIAFYPADAHMAFAYYVPPNAGAPRSILPATAWGGVRPYVEDYRSLAPAELRRLPARCPRLWLVSSHEGQPDGPAGARANRARFMSLRTAVEREYATRVSTRFGYAATITVERLSTVQGRSAVDTKVA